MYKHVGYNYVGIPAFQNYKHMKEHYESVAPIRGRIDDQRPIGRRRYYWYEIAKKQIVMDLSPENPLGSFATSYICRVYNTDCVEWLPNEDIILRLPRWTSATTFGLFTYALADKGTIVSASGKWYFRNKLNEDFLFDNELVLRKDDEDGHYRAVETKQEYKYKAKRKELNAIRKKYTGFIEYTRTMLLIDGKIHRDYDEQQKMLESLGMTSFNLVGNWGNPESNRPVLLKKALEAQASNDLDLMYKLAQVCALTFGNYSYHSNHYSCDAVSFERGFNEVLKYEYAKDVFEKVEVPKGEAFIDRNAKYL